MAPVFRKLKHCHRYMIFLLCSTFLLLCVYFQNSAMVFTFNSYFSFVPESSSCGCHTCPLGPGHEDWFSARYSPTVHLMLNSSNSVLRSDVFNWWKGLQIVKQVATYPTVVKNLFPLFPDKEHYSDAGPHRCRTCAVVGNSGNLLGSHYGPLIDSKDFVMRINKGPTKGFEKDVGFRTTHRMMYPESAVDLDNSTHLVFFPYKILDIEWIISAFTSKNITRTYTEVPSTIMANKDKVMIIHPEFMKYVHVNWTESEGRYPSTGFLTLIFALHICDEVNVFGFGATKDGRWHHYFDKTLTRYVNESHAGDVESKEILRLQREKRIEIFKGLT